jgi:alkylhydroperoxidase family enzyme
VDTVPAASHDGPRIEPIAAGDETERVRAFFAHVEGSGLPGLASLNIVRTLARHTDLATPYFDFGQHILRGSSLPPRVQVLATLRTAWLYDCDYEWRAHARFARHIGMTAEEVEAVRLGADASEWSETERAVIHAVDELRSDTTVTDATWDSLAESFTVEQLLDLLFTVGHYAMMALVLNALRVPPDR